MTGRALNVLVPSIVDPVLHRGGAGTVTRNLTTLFERDPLGARIEYVCPPSAGRKFHRGRQVASLARSLVSPLPSKALLTHSRRFKHDVGQMLIGGRFDLVLLNGSDLLWLLEVIPTDIPRILIAHNIEQQLFLSQIDTCYPNPGFRRNALMRDWRSLRDYETAGIREAGDVIFLSEQDSLAMCDSNPRLRSIVVPPVFDYGVTDRHRAARGDGIDIGLVGNFSWWPNVEGLRWFLEKVFPHTSADLRLHLFGERSLTATPSHPRIVNHGFVETMADIWSACDFMICPASVGGGVNVKLAEAIYNRVPVLTTSFGAKGLSLPSDPGIKVIDGASSWIDFLTSDEARRLGSATVSETVRSRFAMETHAGRLQSFVRACLSPSEPVAIRPRASVATHAHENSA